MTGIRKNNGTRNSSQAKAAESRVADVAAETADVSIQADATETVDAFEGIETQGLFAEYVRNGIGIAEMRSTRIGKTSRVILDEMIAKQRERYGSLYATDEVRALAIEIHKAARKNEARKSGYIQLTVSEAARELIMRVSEEREAEKGKSVIGIERFKAYAATQEKERKARGGNGGGSRKIDVESARLAAEAAIAALESADTQEGEAEAAAS